MISIIIIIIINYYYSYYLMLHEHNLLSIKNFSFVKSNSNIITTIIIAINLCYCCIIRNSKSSTFLKPHQTAFTMFSDANKTERSLQNE